MNELESSRSQSEKIEIPLSYGDQMYFINVWLLEVEILTPHLTESPPKHWVSGTQKTMCDTFFTDER